jgi:hypothetical protein
MAFSKKIEGDYGKSITLKDLSRKYNMPFSLIDNILNELILEGRIYLPSLWPLIRLSPGCFLGLYSGRRHVVFPAMLFKRYLVIRYWEPSSHLPSETRLTENAPAPYS